MTRQRPFGVLPSGVGIVRGFSFLIVSAIVISGCTSAPETAAPGAFTSDTPPSIAEEPMVSVSEGVVRGIVMDDELVPLAGVNVSLEKTGRSTLTDPLGGFTFNLLTPGTYHVAAQTPGYSGAAKRVEVLAGAVTWANFTLLELASTAFYADVVPKTAFIDIGQFQLENSVLRPAGRGCTNCMIPFQLGDNYRQFRAEYLFRPSPDYPQTEEVLCYHLFRNTTAAAPNTVTHEYINTGCLATRGNVTYATPTTLRLPNDQITWYVTPDRIPSYQQRLDIWFSISHNGDLPPGHTALPPP